MPLGNEPLGDVANQFIFEIERIKMWHLVAADHVSKYFWVQLLGEDSRALEVAEHDRELAAFGFRGSRSRCWKVFGSRFGLRCGWL